MKLSENQIKKHTERYYRDLANYQRLNQHSESTTEMAFKSLLKNIGDENDLILIKPYESLYNDKKIVPDGIITSPFGRYLGFWEAKDTDDNLDTEIYKKLQKGYPRNNTIFEDTKTAVLYQDSYEIGRYDLKNEKQLIELLIKFFAYNEPILEEFNKAVTKFKENIPRLASSLLEKIDIAKNENIEFQNTVKQFISICAASFHSDIKDSDIDDMLIQHLLTERIFRKIFDNPDFVNKNVIAVQLEKLISILTQSAFSKSEFFKDIDFFYVTIEQEAAKIDNETEKQNFLNNVYELFFQSYSKKNADKNGIVYTPQAIVKFMVKFTNALMIQEFNKTLSDDGVTIIDPCTGTGNFVVEILKNIHPLQFTKKYESEIFCNEIMLLPYYVASVNIEYFYYKQTGKYKRFENIVFTDTLELIEEPDKPQKSLFAFNEINTERAKRQLKNNFVVIIGNPPYNLKQARDFGNRNYQHEIIDKMIAESYVKNSTATLRQINYDPCIKFIRWATNRLNQENGIICYITNNVFMHSTASDGIRKMLAKDFNRIYHIDLGGDMRINKKEVKGNVFGITVGVGISFFVKNKNYSDNKIFYLNLRDENYLKDDYFKILDKFRESKNSFDDFTWTELSIENGKFIFNEQSKILNTKYNNFVALYNKSGESIFYSKTPGVMSGRDEWVYDFSQEKLFNKLTIFSENYNKEIDRLQNYITENKLNKKIIDIDNFVDYQTNKFKWSRDLKKKLVAGKKIIVNKNKIVKALFRPFVTKYLYYDAITNDSPSNIGSLIDRPSQKENLSLKNNSFISINGLGAQLKFSAYITNLFPDRNLTAPSQIFPLFYVKNKKKEYNVTTWILTKLRKELQNEKLSYEQIFYYVYAIFHYENFKQTFIEQLKQNEPRIPILKEHFLKISEIGRRLSKLHLNFDSVAETDLKIVENKEVEKHFNIRKLILSKKDNILFYNDYFSLYLPEDIHNYKVSGRSPIQWIADQYFDIEIDNDEILKLIKKLVTVSLETNKLLKQLNDINYNF